RRRNGALEPLIHDFDVCYRLIWIDVLHFASNCGSQILRIACGTNHEIHPVTVKSGKVHGWRGIRFQRSVTYVTYDSYDLKSLLAHSQHKSFAERVFVRKDVFDKQVADDDYIGTVTYLLRGEVTATQ